MPEAQGAQVAHESPSIGPSGVASPPPRSPTRLSSVVQATQSSEPIMNFKYVVAIIPLESVESVERELRSIHVGGITLTRVKGFGEYKNLFTEDWLSEHMKIEVFVEEAKAERLVEVLLASSLSDVPGAGILAMMTVDKFLHLRTGTEFLPARQSRTPQP